MPIRVDRFRGMIPKLHPTQLPEGAGQIVHNFTPQSGVLAPHNPSGPFVQMHDATTGLMNAGIPENELVIIPKPARPSFNSRVRYCRPGNGEGNWLNATMCTFVQYIDSNGARITSVAHALPVTGRYEHAEWGLNLYCTTGPMGPVTFANGGPYYFRGPRFQFNLSKNPGVYGGPDVNISLPTFVLPSSPVFSSNTVPLTGPDGNVYGEFQVIDYSGPLWDEKIEVTDWDFYTYYFLPFSCSFRVSLNYARNRRTFSYYVSSHVDGEGREGPPSEISNRMLVRPGEYLKLNTPKTAGYKLSLYRSATGNDDFLKVRENVAATFTDLPHPTTNERIPPFGNWVQAIDENKTSASDEERTAALASSILHPAHYGVIHHGDTLWKSDRYRLHAWPKENSEKFTEDIVTKALAGDTIIVFTANRVYGVSGGDPEHGSHYLISDSHPLLNTRGLCKIGNTVFWPTYDGLAACSGGEIRIVTESFFTREDWLAMNPELMIAKTADNCIFLDASYTPVVPTNPLDMRATLTTLQYHLGTDAPTDGIKLRIDLKDPDAAITTFTAYAAGPGTWKSGIYEYPYDLTFDYARVSSDKPVILIGTCDGIDQAQVVINDDTPVALDWQHGRRWCFTLKGEGTISSFEVFDRLVRSGEDVLVWTPQDSPGVRNLRWNYPEAAAIAAIQASIQTEDAVVATLYGGRSEAIVWTGTISDDAMIPIPPEYRTRHTTFRLELDTDIQVNQVVAAREVQVPGGEFIAESFAGLLAPWTLRRYVWQEPTQLRSLRVHATDAVTMRLYLDGATTPTQEIAVEGEWETRLTSANFSSLRIDFVDADGNPADRKVESFVLATSVPVEIPPDGAHFAGAPAYRRQVYRFPERSDYSACSVVADAYPVYLDIYPVGEDDPAYTVTLNGPYTHALPWEITESNLWEFDLRTDDDGKLETRIHAFHLYPKRGVPVEGASIRVQNPGGAAPWLIARYEFTEERHWPSLRVETTDGSSVWAQLWIDGVAQEALVECPNGQERYILTPDTHLTGRVVEFRFYDGEGGRKQKPADSKVLSVHLYGIEPMPVGNAVVLAEYPYLRREVQFAHAGRFTACQLVMRDGYQNTPVRLRLKTDTQEIVVTPPHDRVFALPAMLTETQWRIGIEVTAEPGEDGGQIVGVDAMIKSLTLYPEETVQAQAIDAGAIPGPPEWLRVRYHFDQPTELAGLYVEAESYPVTLTATLDGAAAPSLKVSATGWVATGWAAASVVTLRFTKGANDPTGMDHVVRRVRLVPLQEVVVGEDGIVVLPEMPFYRKVRIRFAQTGAWAGVSVDAESSATLTLTAGGYVATAAISANDPSLTRVKAKTETVDKAIVSPTYASLWTLDVNATGRIHSVVLLAWRDQPAEEVIQLGPDNGLPMWYRTRYRWPETRVIRSVRYWETTGVALYLDGKKETIDDDENIEHRIDNIYRGSELVLDFKTLRIGGALVACEQHVPIAASGFAIRDAGFPIHRNRILRFQEPGAPSVLRARNAASVRVRKYDSGSWTTANLSAPDYTKVLSDRSGAIAWELDVQDYEGELFELDVFTHVPTVMANGVAVIRSEGDPATWLDRRVLCPRNEALNCMKVVATGSVTVTARNETRGSTLWTRTHSGDGEPIRLPKEDARREWVFDIVPSSSTTEVHEFAVATSMTALRSV